MCASDPSRPSWRMGRRGSRNEVGHPRASAHGSDRLFVADQKFIDHDAEIVYVPRDEVLSFAEREGAISPSMLRAPSSPTATASVRSRSSSRITNWPTIQPSSSSRSCARGRRLEDADGHRSRGASRPLPAASWTSAWRPGAAPIGAPGLRRALRVGTASGRRRVSLRLAGYLDGASVLPAQH